MSIIAQSLSRLIVLIINRLIYLGIKVDVVTTIKLANLPAKFGNLTIPCIIPIKRVSLSLFSRFPFRDNVRSECAHHAERDHASADEG